MLVYDPRRVRDEELYTYSTASSMRINTIFTRSLEVQWNINTDRKPYMWWVASKERNPKLREHWSFSYLLFALDGNISLLTLHSEHVCPLLQRQILSPHSKAIANLPSVSKKKIYIWECVYGNIYRNIHMRK